MEVNDDESKPVKAKPPAYPSTLGEFVGLGWRMHGLCVPRNGTGKFQIDIAAAAKSPQSGSTQGRACSRSTPLG